jgi:hypothetical protein
MLLNYIYILGAYPLEEEMEIQISLKKEENAKDVLCSIADSILKGFYRGSCFDGSTWYAEKDPDEFEKFVAKELEKLD